MNLTIRGKTCVIALRLGVMNQAPHEKMRRALATAGLVVMLPGFGPAEAADLSTQPITYVTPAALDFGRVTAKTTATNTFLVENLGQGRLIGRATVSPPFKIISGENYDLTRLQAQVVTITYTPSKAGADTQTVTFTGGGAVTRATVTGRLSKAPPSGKPARR
jgi:hypothetical protein